jgi:two-component system cell cycle sensor histidine kinase PleC
VTHIRGSGLGLLRIINDILEISRLEAGHLPIDAREIAVAGLVEDAVGAVTAAAGEKNVSISTLISGETAVLGDERAVRQSLIHLLQNAVKFTPSGGSVRVRVSPAGPSVNIFVEDSGIGISRDFLPRLGRPFEQAEPEFNRVLGGAGLGLAIAKALTEMNGGDLRIRSREGTGTIVLLRLPRSESARLDARPPIPVLVPFLQAAE